MSRIVVLIFGAVFSLSAFANLSDSEAKQIAVKTDKAVTKARAELNEMIASGLRVNYSGLRARINEVLRQWPEMNLSNNASFPYFACPQAARDLLQYGDAWNRNDQDKNWRDRAIEKFKETDAACKGAIKRPDLSLKNIK